jgi:hypothetical protein
MMAGEGLFKTAGTLSMLIFTQKCRRKTQTENAGEKKAA